MTPPPLRARALLVAAIAVALVAWASAFVVIRAVAGDFDPGALTHDRMAVALLVLGAAQAVRRQRVRPDRRQ